MMTSKLNGSIHSTPSFPTRSRLLITTRSPFLNHADINIKQSTYISLLEIELKSKVEGYAQRLITIES